MCFTDHTSAHPTGHHHPREGVHHQEGAVCPLGQGDGRLLPPQDETLRGPEDPGAGARGIRLHGVHQDPVPGIVTTSSQGQLRHTNAYTIRCT